MALTRRPRRRDPARAMTIVEHLEELRIRLVISLVAVALGAVGGWLLFRPVFDFLREPLCDYVAELPRRLRPPTGCRLVATGVVEPFLVRFKVSAFTGLGLALPVVLYQLWRFITPGLTQRERRLAVPFVLSSLVLFALGGWFAFITLPRGLGFLLGFSGAEIAPLLTVSRYISFVLLLVLAFGVSFEFPLVLIFLAWAGVVSSRTLRRWRRYAYLVIAIFAAVITPSQDPYTMLAMSVPMAVFYEAAILVARLLNR